jgi:hypothetical protein
MRNVMKKRCVFILAAMVLCNSIAQGDIPKSGTFDIDGPSAVSFDLIPWVSPNPYLYTYMWPFASDDLYAGSGAQYNLAEIAFSNSSFAVTDDVDKSGYLGIRVGNYTGNNQTFEACILTLDFIGSGSFDIHLPGFTFETNDNIFFWVSQTGATYYANSLKGVGLPDISAAEAMAAGDEYLAMAPEPATILLFGLGSFALLKFNRRAHSTHKDFLKYHSCKTCPEQSRRGRN